MLQDFHLLHYSESDFESDPDASAETGGDRPGDSIECVSEQYSSSAALAKTTGRTAIQRIIQDVGKDDSGIVGGMVSCIMGLPAALQLDKSGQGDRLFSLFIDIRAGFSCNLPNHCYITAYRGNKPVDPTYKKA